MNEAMTLPPGSHQPTPASMSHSRRPESTLEDRTPAHRHRNPAAGWELNILPAAADYAVRLGADEQDLVDALSDPESRVPGFNGCTWHVRGHVAVLVSPDHVAMSVRSPAAVPGPRQTAGTGKSLCPTGNRRWNPPTEPAKMVDLLKEDGFTVERNGSGHYRVTHPRHRGKACVMPATPSDRRWARNFVSEIRRTFGLEIKR
ncbi:hypothetical protein LG293_17820 (plasmid) [Citricoccus nitrophenolicus]